MDNWQRHTGRYVDRTIRLAEPLDRLRDALQPLPSAPLDFRPSARGLMFYQLCILVVGNHRSAGQLCYSIKDFWVSGRFLPVSLSTRLLMEVWGAGEFLRREILEKLEQTDDFEVAQKKVSKFLFGSKSEVPLPRGGVSDEKPIHVMDMVRQADVAAPGAMADYEFLCDACHPCHLQHTYLMFAGSDHDNWSNTKFASYGHQILDRTLKAAEGSVKGITEAGIAILDRTMPVILADRDRPNE
jgi:hypothetical protein